MNKVNQFSPTNPFASVDQRKKLAAARKQRDLAHKREIRVKTKGKTAAQRMMGE